MTLVAKLLLAGVTSTTLAAGGAYTAVTLSQSSIERFLDSLEELQADDSAPLVEELADVAVEGREESTVSLPFTSFIKGLSNDPYRDAFLKTIADHGFEDEEQWAATGDKLVRVMIASENPDEYVALGQSISKIMTELGVDATLTEQERREAIERLEQERASALALAPSLTEAFVARTYINRFENILEDSRAPK